MSRTRRIYNDTKRWINASVGRVSEGYQDGLWAIRHWAYHPFRQHKNFTCHCSWCHPKATEHGALRAHHKNEIRLELAQL